MKEKRRTFDGVNALFAVLVFLGSFVVYALTVQRTFSFWDCGEFIACAYTLGIPHPPGFPLYVLLGRIASTIPFVEDISYRVNYISVLSSAATAMFSYLLTVKLARHCLPSGDGLNRIVAYLGGITGGFFVAFSMTNWANSVEAEVYGLSLALMVLACWFAVRYFETRGTGRATQIMVLVFYLALLGVGVHLTVFLVVPFCATFFVLRPEARAREYLLVCLFIIMELFLVVVFANGRGGIALYYLLSAVMMIGLVVMTYRRIDWALSLAIVSVSSIMIGFKAFLVVAPAGTLVLLLLASIARKRDWRFSWKPALAIMVVGFLGFSVHLVIPIRSAHDPQIDMNNTSQDFATFVDFLERKQYGEQSMVDRMFQRRGTWGHQFGRHPHMGFWSYFEEQYSNPGWGFIPFLVLGLLGMYVAVRKRLEVGLPFFTLFLVCSAGLILYMNFADGIKFNPQTGDAYMEVRNRDYFFTPAFVFFGIAMGMGVSAVAAFVKGMAASERPAVRSAVACASIALILLPAVALAKNYPLNDRSDNYLPFVFGANMLDTCKPNALLFTTGDNETYPLWCLQHVYGFRSDVRVVNLSLLSINWYVEQMKNQYGVPMSLTDEQIVTYPVTVQSGVKIRRPREMFLDRPRKRRTYLMPSPHDNRIVSVADMIVDDIVLENHWRDPVYFSSLPYPESPLNLQDRVQAVGLLYSLERQSPEQFVNVDESFDLFVNRYSYTGLDDPGVCRDNGVTRDFLMTLGMTSVRAYEGLMRMGDEDRARALMEKLVDVYPEYWQAYFLLSQRYDQDGDSASADSVLCQLRDTLTAFMAANEDNNYYLQDMGMVTYQLGRRHRDDALTNSGLEMIWEAFRADPNDPYTFRKLILALSETGRTAEMQLAGQMAAAYKRNLGDPVVQQVLGMSGAPRRP